jgi:F0F1-type ATP synthase assembly protein I
LAEAIKNPPKKLNRRTEAQIDMTKLWYGVLLGAVLGIFDGLSAWFTPAVRDQVAGIVVGSTIKGAIAGAVAGWFARKVNSVPLGILVGLATGMLLAYGVAALQHGYYFQIMLPGSLVGAIVGFATQKYQPSRLKAQA